MHPERAEYLADVVPIASDGGPAMEATLPEPPSDVVPDTVTTSPTPASKPSAPKWEEKARARIKSAVQQFRKPLTDLVERDANEGETRILVTDVLCAALGYDKYVDLTMEYQVKGQFADYGIRLDKQLVAFVEVKRCTQKLGQKHLHQVQLYAVNEGVEWMFLTNGQVWQVWHLRLPPGQAAVLDMVAEVDLLSDLLPQRVDGLFCMSKEAVKHHHLDELWRVRAAMAPRSITEALLSETVLDALRKEIRRQRTHNPKLADLRSVLTSKVLRPDVL